MKEVNRRLVKLKLSTLVSELLEHHRVDLDYLDLIEILVEMRRDQEDATHLDQLEISSEH